MRAFALVLSGFLGCCSPAADLSAPDPGGAHPPSPSVSPGFGALSFSVAPELEAKYPAVRAEATEAAARWGLELVFSDAAVSHLELGEIPASADPVARHRPLRMADGVPRSATEGGASLITIDPDAVLTESSAADCSAAWREGQQMPALLVSVLTHEFGHMLGLDDEPMDYDAVMFFSTRLCTDSWPTVAELGAADAAHEHVVVNSH